MACCLSVLYSRTLVTCASLRAADIISQKRIRSNMAYRDLRAFLNRLEERGDLHRVRAEVDPILEITEITDRMCKSPGGGKALYFEKVKGSAYPVVTNIFGSFERICLALEISHLDDVAHRIGDLLNLAPPKTLVANCRCCRSCLNFRSICPRLSGTLHVRR